MDKNNLLGIKMDVNEEVLSTIVQQTLVASVAASLDNKDAIIHELVQSVLSRKVCVKDGSEPRYSSDATCTLIEYWVRRAMEETVKEQFSGMVEQMKPAIAIAIRRELGKAKTMNKFVEMFIDSMTVTLSSKYRTNINVEFREDD